MRVCPNCNVSYEDSMKFCTDDGAELRGEVELGIWDDGTSPTLGTVLGSYRLLDLLGEGGMGRVYTAEHTRLGRKVALKLLRPDYSADPKAAARFFSEARAVNQIQHENIIQITDFVEDQGPEKYYIMELLEGESMAALQRREGAIPLDDLLSICIQVCNALAAVHDAGMVHRDLKPENIYLIERGGKNNVVKLLDFGVVKLGNLPSAQQLGQTAAGAILGTPEYMSPEQVSSNPVDYRTDVYALGVILYEGMTGRKPFMARSFGEMVVNHLTVKPPKPSSLNNLPGPVPSKLESLALQCLAKDRENRPQSMREIEKRLRDMAADAPSLTARRVPQRRVLIGAVVAAAVLLAAGGLALALSSDEEKTENAPALVAKPARPASVKVNFDSNPRGAEVFIDGKEEPLGLTPFSMSMARSESPRAFSFKLAGHDTTVQEIMLAADSRISVTLARSQEPAREARSLRQRSKKQKVGRRGTLDPFADN